MWKLLIPVFPQYFSVSNHIPVPPLFPNFVQKPKAILVWGRTVWNNRRQFFTLLIGHEEWLKAIIYKSIHGQLNFHMRKHDLKTTFFCQQINIILFINLQYFLINLSQTKPQALANDIIALSSSQVQCTVINT